MSNYQAIQSIEEALTGLLKNDEVLEKIGPKPKFFFETPPKELSTTENNVYFFLYQVAENVHMKNEEMMRMDDTHLKHPPISLDLYYLLILYGSGRNLVLGRILQIFHDHSIMKGAELNLDNEDEEIKIIFNTISLDDLTKIWSAFKETGYALSVSYLITPVRIDSTREMGVHRVVSTK
jgi:hypothetical protein